MGGSGWFHVKHPEPLGFSAESRIADPDPPIGPSSGEGEAPLLEDPADRGMIQVRNPVR